MDGDESEDTFDKQDLTHQVNELFRHIYNDEMPKVRKLTEKVFPQLEGKG